MSTPVNFRSVVDAIFDYTKLCKEQRVKWGEINNDKKAEMVSKYEAWQKVSFPEIKEVL